MAGRVELLAHNVMAEESKFEVEAPLCCQNIELSSIVEDVLLVLSSRCLLGKLPCLCFWFLNVLIFKTAVSSFNSTVTYIESLPFLSLIFKLHLG
jgi:hypothetical protein